MEWNDAGGASRRVMCDALLMRPSACFAVIALASLALLPSSALAQPAPRVQPEQRALSRQRVTLTVRTPPGRREAYQARLRERDAPHGFPYRARRIQYERVAYSVAIQRAIESELRNILRASMAAHERPGVFFDFSLQCRATLATTTLVVYLCASEAASPAMAARDMGPERLWSAHAWEVGATLRPVSLDDLLLPGGERDGMLVAPTQTGVIFANRAASQPEREQPFEELAAVLNMQSILGRIPRAVQASMRARETRPRVRVTATPLPFARAVIEATARGSRWLFAPEGVSSIDATTELVMELAPALGGASQESAPSRERQELTAQLHVESLVLTRPTQLRALPDGAPGGVMLPTHTFVRGVVGTFSAALSSVEPGQYVLVVASEGLVGWLPAEAVRHVPTAGHVIQTFIEALPTEGRPGIFGVIEVVGEGFLSAGHIVYGAHAGGSVVGLVRAPDELGHADARFSGSLHHPGMLVDARLVSLRDGNSLMLLAWLLPGDATHHHWEAHRLTENSLAQESLFSITLGLPEGPPEERVLVATELERRRVYYPFVVRGPGRSETLYTWNGTTLVAE